jgi:hypothetical protein
MAKEEFDTTRTHYLTCPHCGYEHEDFEGEEYNETITRECDNCEKEFVFEAECVLKFTSKKKSTENEGKNV